jgi:NAD(P)-dependent dehydrogenase (short-subunit alcohol dehydrogenase family)
MANYRWLITGASSGQGAEIALAALKAGHFVLATARNVVRAQEANPVIERLGGVWASLDVTSDDAQSVTEKLVKEHSITVLVNNAGYGLRGVLEDLR